MRTQLRHLTTKIKNLLTHNDREAKLEEAILTISNYVEHATPGPPASTKSDSLQQLRDHARECATAIAEDDGANFSVHDVASTIATVLNALADMHREVDEYVGAYHPNNYASSTTETQEQIEVALQGIAVTYGWISHVPPEATSS